MKDTVDPPVPPRQTLTHRHDIDGLRGLAIVLVVVFHVFVGRVSSGVDVFLLIGGIFFFGPQIRNALNPRGLTVVQAFLRIFRRLYPALVVVVGVTLAIAVAVYAQVRWAHASWDAVASLLYFQNLNLASAGQDYSAIGTDVSLYQHIWSMSAQLQVYLGSLLVITLVVGALSLVFREPAGGRACRVLVTAATVASFAYAVHLHGTDQGLNYYSPLSRFWEIGLGGLFGFYLLRRPVPRRLRRPAGLVGLALIICTGLFLDGAAQFPGPLTLIPLAGAALVILAGNPVREDADGEAAEAAGPTAADRPVGVTALLSTRLFQSLGRMSYSLYLWHWPLLVLATFYFSTGTVTTAGGLSGITATLGTGRGAAVGVAVIVVSAVLAWLTNRYIEKPLQQQAKPVRSWIIGDRGYLFPSLGTGAGKVRAVSAGVLAVVTVGVLAFNPWVDARNSERARALTVTDVDQAMYPGPAALLDGAPVPDVDEILPDPIDDGPMMADTLKDVCAALFDTTDLVWTKNLNRSDEPCVYGDVESDRTMYLVGGSHSEHYLPALELIARQRHIKIVPILKLGCVLGMGDLPKWDGSDYPECKEWDEKAQDYIFHNPPTDGVFMTVTRPTTIQGDGPDQVPAEYFDIVRKLSDAGIHTWGVRDTPWILDRPGAQGNARVCVADGDYERDNPEKDCGVDRAEAMSPVNPAIEAYAGLDVTDIDITNAVCTETRCPGVVGNVLVYRDAQHFTNLFAAQLAPEIYRQMYDGGSISDTAAPPDGSGGAASWGRTGEEPTEGPAPKDVRRMAKPLEEGYIEPDPTLLEKNDDTATSASTSAPPTPEAPEPVPEPVAPPFVDLDGDGYDDNIFGPGYGFNYNPYGYGYGGGYGY
ncbi:acyltransferase family protein [uncultured Corynebacterium sp.]|uniref:acyltransferase family protein n=1 Tax=uncultured Corynebacterium sp. TaxID=159447 RepID=UPI0025FCFA50|nr:acyltransferase family protein [uncultured Corynebacterium sp.]